jgi:ribonuclease HII
VDWWIEERAARGRGFSVICGVDEAGRGPLAGPVVAAAVILPFEQCPEGIRDSKTLTPQQRDRAHEALRECALGIGVGSACVESVDEINILRASHQAMRDAVAALPVIPDAALIDGLPVQPFPVPQIALVKGDGRSASIAAASIIAKVERDRIMCEYDALYPHYGFARHKGYSTPEHLTALRDHGPCPIHRRSFAPVTEALCQTSLELDIAARKETGVTGEAVARAHMERLGWEILAARYSVRGGELDLVARENGTLVFAEVKTRRGGCFGEAAEAVTPRKRARMLIAAEAFLYERELGEVDCRFDVIEVAVGRDGLHQVHLLRDAFLAGE